MKQQAQHNQTVLDFVLHQTGSMLSVLEFCLNNGISMTGDLVAGADYQVAGLVNDADIRDYYLQNNYVPATGTTAETDYGIGQMSIANTFIIR